MKKVTVLMLVVLSVALASVVFAADKGENMVGKLFLFQKCDSSLIPDAEAGHPQFDSNGCPLPGAGPWPIFPDNRRWGQMKYNLLGDKFRFSFQGNRLLPETDYTLIYYPDNWPGKGLICLGSDVSNPDGNLQIKGDRVIPSGLPAPYDKNFNPVEPSGAVGAKIWLVTSADVQCEGSDEVDSETGLPIDPPQMIGWNPTSYLFEGNLIVYQYWDADVNDEDDDITATDIGDSDFDEDVPKRQKISQQFMNGNNGKRKDK